MKTWAYWLPDLLPHVRGCPVVLARHELRRAAKAFFQKSRAWQIDLAAHAVGAAQRDVVVSMPAGADLVRVEQAWFDSRRLALTTAAELDAEYEDDWSTRSGAPTHFYQLVPGTVSLFPIPLDAAASGLKIRVSAAPGDAATGLDDDLAARFQDEIHVGAKARLMIYADKPWSNPQMAGVYASAFDDMANSARTAATRSYGSGRLPSRAGWC